MGNKPHLQPVYIVLCEIQVQRHEKGKRLSNESESRNNETGDESTDYKRKGPVSTDESTKRKEKGISKKHKCTSHPSTFVQ